MKVKSTLSNVLIFATGAAIGAVVTWKFMRIKYDRLIQEEVDSVKEAFSKRYCVEPEGEDQDDTVANPTDEEDLLRAADKEMYEQLTMDYGNDKEVEMVGAMRIIPPEEFGEEDGYDTVSLTYYADGVITDELDEPLENADDVIGPNIESHFGEYEDDSVFVRNDELETDYEILRDERRYSDVINSDPQTAEGE